MYRRLLISLLFALLSWEANAQLVWPGDVTNNGRVDVVDVLYWGIASGQSGPARMDASTDWVGQPAPMPWSQNFPNGVNYAFADADGNGVIDEEDLDDAIDENIGLTHGEVSPEAFANAQPGQGPQLLLIPDITIAEEGTRIRIDLVIDDQDFPITNFQGMALKMSYSADLLRGDDGPDFDINEDGWIENDGNDAISLTVENDPVGKTELAITRVGNQPVEVGEEAIGTFTVVIEDIIIGLAVDTFELTIDSVLLFTEDLSTLSVVPTNGKVIVAKDSSLVISSTAEPTEQPQNITVFPNPSTGDFIIDTPVPIDRISLHDVFGRSLSIQLSNHNPQQIRVSTRSFRPGPHWLRLRTPEGVISRKLILNRNPKTF